METLITVIIILIVVGAGLYIVNSVIPMDQRIKTAINVIIIVAVAIWLLTDVVLPLLR